MSHSECFGSFRLPSDPFSCSLRLPSGSGWSDCDLTNRGKEEARFAGSLLREAGVTRLERVYTSFLKRAIKTSWLMLDELELQWVPVEYTWRLNERHYGALQGRDKVECSRRFGAEQVQKRGAMIASNCF